MSRIYIITGKGGVGKTSLAAAHAVRSAREGHNTLLVSADMAHNLGDIFQTKAGGYVQEIAPSLSVLELDPYMLMREEYPNINKTIANLSGTVGAAIDCADGGDALPLKASGTALLVCGEVLSGWKDDDKSADTGRQTPLPDGTA